MGELEVGGGGGEWVGEEDGEEGEEVVGGTW